MPKRSPPYSYVPLLCMYMMCECEPKIKVINRDGLKELDFYQSVHVARVPLGQELPTERVSTRGQKLEIHDIIYVYADVRVQGAPK